MKVKQLILMTGDELSATVPLARSMKLISDHTSSNRNQDLKHLLQQVQSKEEFIKHTLAAQELRESIDALNTELDLRFYDAVKKASSENEVKPLSHDQREEITSFKQ